MRPGTLKTSGLTKTYGDFTALKDVSITVEDGDIYGLVGRNGAGKTTLFKCVMGLTRPTSGTIGIGDDTSLNRARAGVGFTINSSFFPYLSAEDNLEYLRRVKGIRHRGESARVLKIVGLDGVKKPFSAFSMGMKQRLGIASALLGRPSMVILDEPINGLDPQGIMDMREVIRGARDEGGATVIVSSHILSELDLVATRFGFIDQGVLLQEITHDDLHEHTQESWCVEVDNAPRALTELTLLGLRATVDGHRLTVPSRIEHPDAIARALVESGIGLLALYRQDVTLEEYFVNLVGGVSND